ncbi:MAG: FluC/FEX family fluoride channel [Egibacteraceae bacterium]
MAAGGALGTLLRAGSVVRWAQPPGGWPLATLAVNLLGTFALGAVVGSGRPRGAIARTALSAGLLGALTTFSTIIAEAMELVISGRTGRAAAYLAVSIACGLAVAALGVHAGRTISEPAG